MEALPNHYYAIGMFAGIARTALIEAEPSPTVDRNL